MLYDNGALLALYAQACLASGDDAFRRVAERTAAYLLDDLRAENGGFFSARDADSEGREGRYYIWQKEEIREVLDAPTFAAAATHFGLDEDANFDDAWHLGVAKPVETVAAELKLAEEDVTRRLDTAAKRLKKRRETRIPPARDEKQLTAWNALAARGLAVAGRALGRADLVDAAGETLGFVRRELFRDDRLLATFTDGTAKLGGYLDDHAFLLDALLEQLQARYSAEHLHFAIRIADPAARAFLRRAQRWFLFHGERRGTPHAPPKNRSPTTRCPRATAQRRSRSHVSAACLANPAILTPPNAPYAARGPH